MENQNLEKILLQFINEKSEPATIVQYELTEVKSYPGMEEYSQEQIYDAFEDLSNEGYIKNASQQIFGNPYIQFKSLTSTGKKQLASYNN